MSLRLLKASALLFTMAWTSATADVSSTPFVDSMAATFCTSTSHQAAPSSTWFVHPSALLNQYVTAPLNVPFRAASAEEHLHTHHHGQCCCVLSPHMLDKIHAYGLEHGIQELVELVNVTRAAGDRRIHTSRARKIEKLKERNKDRPFSEGILAAAGQRTPEPVVSIYDAAGHQTFGFPRSYHTYTLEKQTPISGASAWVDQGLVAIFATLNFYWDQFKWNSIDGKGIPLKAVVNYAPNFFNAYFDGTKEVFGNPGNDKTLAQWFGSFTSDIDVAAHELTHGVTQYKGGLVYEGQSGAINEHLSDVFGIQVKHYYFHQKNQPLPTTVKWKIGDNVLKDIAGKHYALRDMLNPGQGYVGHPMLGDDPQPHDFSSYQELDSSEDNGGVHLYSGPLNRAFALVSEALGGNSWEKAGVIWYHAYDKITPNATFVDLANITIQLAQELYGSDVAATVRKAWDTISVWDTAPAQEPLAHAS